MLTTTQLVDMDYGLRALNYLVNNGQVQDQLDLEDLSRLRDIVQIIYNNINVEVA